MAHRPGTGIRWVAWAAVILFAAGTWALARGTGAFDPGGLTEEELAGRGGSADPCAVPLGWRIADVDPRFGIDRSRAAAAARQAVEYWESALGAGILPHDPVDGLPIRFGYDERQQTVQARQQAAQELAELDVRLDSRRAVLDREYDLLDRDLEVHNARVQDWNRRGGAPPAVAEELRRSAAALESRRRALDDRMGQLNRDLDERNRKWERLQQEFPDRRVESGHYGEQVRIRNGRVSEVFDREILVWYFDDPSELPVLIAHEFGHALGLGHAEGPGAVMSPVQTANLEELHSTDLQMLARICPDLVKD